MKIQTIVPNVRVLAKETTKSKDGSNEYYKLAVLVGAECGNLSCSKDVYDCVEADHKYTLGGTYNDQYKSFKLDTVVPVADKQDKNSPTSAR